MLSDYRNWLESELKLLGNASHHAYSFGQANMAKRAIERLDAELANRTPVLLEPDDATAALSALERLLASAAAPEPALEKLLAALRAALAPGV
jgi:hypothetical protein